MLFPIKMVKVINFNFLSEITHAQVLQPLQLLKHSERNSRMDTMPQIFKTKKYRYLRNHISAILFPMNTLLMEFLFCNNFHYNKVIFDYILNLNKNLIPRLNSCCTTHFSEFSESLTSWGVGC